MFGVPDYFSFDPTPYLAVSFLIFFGFCFGDVIYGAMLCLVAGYLAWKARWYEGLNDFCMLFFYCGVTTMVVGVLTGSWASDLPRYFGEGNLWERLKDRTTLVDPLGRPMLVLLVAIALGVINQFFGIVLKGYGALRKGDIAGAIFDSGLWLIALPGFLIVLSMLFFPALPRSVFKAGLIMLGLGGLGLVLTQGRNERGIVAKAATGAVSLYGILGSYGCISFFGDVLSYSRLLALGLTTVIVGMSFNLMAGLVRGVPWAGVLLFILVLIIGHAFNFAVSILGSFIHPARLIFLEFFSRFYQGGGLRFRPLSRDNHLVMVVPS
jgi:V/A-type H+-transporting ATPase subunit I